MITILPITEENKSALALPNDPFFCDGRIIPRFDGKNWAYSMERFSPENCFEDQFPDENYDFDNMGEGFHGLAAYVGNECAGYALLYEQWNKYLYLDNLLVVKKHRHIGVGSRLLDAGMKLALELDKAGVYLICQDNNPGALQFYFANGFDIGGINTRVYDNTAQEGKTDLYLYKSGV